MSGGAATGSAARGSGPTGSAPTGSAATGGGYGALLRQYRQASGLTQEELAARSGLSVRAIADMERGRTLRPYQASLRSLANALALAAAERERLIQAAIRSTVGAVGTGSPGTASTDTPGTASTGNPGTASTGNPGTAGTDTSGRVAQAAGPVAASRQPAVPRQLPPALPHFAGRAAELATLTGLLDAAAASQTLLIAAITGTAGAGKTTLARHWAHRVAGRFPDGQLHADLRGFDPSGDPSRPAEVIRGFLAALGMPPDKIPAATRDRAGLYRSLLAGRSMLIVLDNARDAAQVRPLLPGSPACLVVVTSRSRLTGLAAADGASLLHLDMLSPADARELLTSRVGADRVAAEPQAASDLIGLCAGLPLALAIAAARAAASPALTLDELAGEMRVTARALDALDTGEPATSLRAVFSWSYQDLGEPAARLFRLLGVHRGPDITAAAAASLAGQTPARSLAVLRELAQCHLVSEQPGGRYSFHDMLRAYAAELAAAQDSEPDRRAAIHRVLDHYLHTARAAALLLLPHHDMVPVPQPQPGVTPERLSGPGQALAWFRAEHQALLAAIAQADGDRFDAHARDLPSAMTVFLDRSGCWDDYAATQRTALSASQRLADAWGQARAHRGLGHAATRLGAFARARAHYEQALELYRELSDQPGPAGRQQGQAAARTGRARVHSGLAFLFEQQGRYREALEQCLLSLEQFRALGDRPRQANALGNIGWCHAMTGSYQQALDYGYQTIALYAELDDQHGQAAAWDTVGYASHHLADFTEAARCYQEAAARYGENGDLYAKAITLTHLGDTHLAAGRPRGARAAWQPALEILTDLDPDEAGRVRARLAGLGTRSPAVRSPAVRRTPG